jgi:hypothetical protein
MKSKKKQKFLGKDGLFCSLDSSFRVCIDQWCVNSPLCVCVFFFFKNQAVFGFFSQFGMSLTTEMPFSDEFFLVYGVLSR